MTGAFGAQPGRERACGRGALRTRGVATSPRGVQAHPATNVDRIVTQNTFRGNVWNKSGHLWLRAHLRPSVPASHPRCSHRHSTPILPLHFTLNGSNLYRLQKTRAGAAAGGFTAACRARGSASEQANRRGGRQAAAQTNQKRYYA